MLSKVPGSRIRVPTSASAGTSRAWASSTEVVIGP